MKPVEGRRRVVIEEVQPQVDCGRYPAKRILGDRVTITAAVFGDGHDHVAGRMLYRHSGEDDWRSTPLEPLTNDLWSASFTVDKLGDWLYTIEAWVDHFDTWCADLRKRVGAQTASSAPPSSSESQDIPLALRSGASVVRLGQRNAPRAPTASSSQTRRPIWTVWPKVTSQHTSSRSAKKSSLSPRNIPISSFATRYHQELPLWVDRERARYSTWYELFPRSASPDPTRHGTFADVKALLPRSPPWASTCSICRRSIPSAPRFARAQQQRDPDADDPGSPWAIGSKEGGHKAIHPQLGTLRDFDALVAAARDHGMELALDIAFQCSPDHPWVSEHPDWFVHPPRRLDPIRGESAEEISGHLSVRFRILRLARPVGGAATMSSSSGSDAGVRIFRVDNPHTKASRLLGVVHRRDSQANIPT